MTNVTVIGAGNMGSAIAEIVAKGGAAVQTLVRDQDAAKAAGVGTIGDDIAGDIVFLAIPHDALTSIVETYGAQLDGKILVDLTNPVDMTTFDSLTVPADSSAAAELAARVPGARIVKAFNTTFAATLTTGTVGTTATTVLIAGDDEDAKATVSALITEGGIAVADAGSLKRARELEAFAFLQIILAVRGTVGWDAGFAVTA